MLEKKEAYIDKIQGNGVLEHYNEIINYLGTTVQFFLLWCYWLTR